MVVSNETALLACDQTFTNVAPVTPGASIEASAVCLASLGLPLLLLGRSGRRRAASLLVGSLVAALASVPDQAQTKVDPDYSQVSDVLNGQRTLLNVTDLEMVYSANPGNTASKGTILITTANSSQTLVANSSLPNFDQTKNAQLFSARMFNQPSAITLTPLYNANNTGALTFWLQGITSLPGGVTPWIPLSPGDQPNLNCGVVADFTQDGYDDVAFGFADGRILVAAPNDPNDATKGFRQTITTLNALQSMAAGDFNGDGRYEIAGLTVVPYDQKGGGGLALVIYTVDPQSLAVTPATALVLTTPGASASNPITRSSLTRSRFNNAGHDQLAVAFTTPAGPQSVEIIDFDANTLKAREASALSPANVAFPYGIVQVKTGKFGLPTNPYDQIIYHSSSPSAGGRFFQTLSVDPATLKLATHSGIAYNDYPCLAEIDVGNFDHRQPDPLNSGQTQPNLNDQIAFLYYDNRNGTAKAPYYLNVYSVDPGSLNVNNSPESNLRVGVFATDRSIDAVAFVSTDLQGRSYVLGPPTKVVVKRSIQPSVIAAMPPMHVDFVPQANSSEPEILNLSVIPSGFNTTYQTNETDTNQSSTVSTTSWSFGAQQSLGVGFEVGSVDAGSGLKGSSVSTAAQDLKGSIETEYGSYTRSSFDASVKTGFSDSVWYSASRFNIWVYPVIGKSVCPAGASGNCPQQKPLTIQFSAPDQLEYAKRDGVLLPWYQPVWEPGNVFSYPATYGQLQAISPNLKALSTPRSSTTDSSTATESISWDNTQNNGLSASFDQNYSFSQEFSLTGAVSAPFTSASFTGTLNFSGSNGFSDLNKSVTSVGRSTGIGVDKPGTFALPGLYAYSFTPYIFGQAESGSVVDKEPLDADVKTSGLLRTAFLADPLAVNPYGWWKQTYNQPDVALNHPQRWDVISSAIAVGDLRPSNCLDTDCVLLQQSNLKNPWSSPFHFMRGFFISSAQNPDQGPQLDTAQAGDQLTLQTRVYNYSLAAMPPDSRVHVRFYVQPLDKDTHFPVGDSLLIGGKDVVLDPIPPFSDDEGAPPNWVLARTDFDTTPYGGQSLVFWVIVWIENANGTLVQEMPGHGLKQIPGVLKSFPDIQMEEQYSNNVGFYNSEFYVFPNNAPLTASSSGEPATINIGKVQLSSESAVSGQIIDVSAQLSATDSSASGLEALFYDGDPDAGGTAFGYELSPYIAENDTYQVKAPYVASACGTHQLFVVVGQGTSQEIVRRAPPVRVDCSQSMARRPVGSAGQKLDLQ